MKQIFFLLLCLASVAASAQAPQGIPYQAIARNASGVAIANTAVKVRFSIRDSIATGAIKYQETHNPTTSALGLFSVNVGMGTVVSGTFSGINWGKNAKFLQVEMDPAGGSTYTDLGITQMMSVPYALYAGSLSQNSSSSGGFSNVAVFDNPDSTFWAVPAGVSKVKIECWGGGGKCVLVNECLQWGVGDCGRRGAGGGGGGYALGVYNVNPGQTLNIITGAGGTENTIKGGRSKVGTLIFAEGGGCSLGGNGYGQINIKGTDGKAIPLPYTFNGSFRYILYPTGGSSPMGGGEEVQPGGGGAYNSGANGRVVISW